MPSAVRVLLPLDMQWILAQQRQRLLHQELWLSAERKELDGRCGRSVWHARRLRVVRGPSSLPISVPRMLIRHPLLSTLVCNNRHSWCNKLPSNVDTASCTNSDGSAWTCPTSSYSSTLYAIIPNVDSACGSIGETTGGTADSCRTGCDGYTNFFGQKCNAYSYTSDTQTCYYKVGGVLSKTQYRFGG